MSSKPIKKTVLLIKKIAEFESNWYNMKKLLMCNKNLVLHGKIGDEGLD